MIIFFSHHFLNIRPFLSGFSLPPGRDFHGDFHRIQPRSIFHQEIDEASALILSNFRRRRMLDSAGRLWYFHDTWYGLMWMNIWYDMVWYDMIWWSPNFGYLICYLAFDFWCSFLFGVCTGILNPATQWDTTSPWFQGLDGASRTCWEFLEQLRSEPPCWKKTCCNWEVIWGHVT